MSVIKRSPRPWMLPGAPWCPMKHLLALLVLVVPGVAWPQAVPLESSQQWSTTPMMPTTAANVACVAAPWDDDTPSCASFEVPTKGMRKIWISVYYTKDTGTEVQIYKDTSMDSGTPWFITTLGDAITPPKVDRAERYESFDVSAASSAETRAWHVPFDVDGPYTRFRFVVVGGTSSDTIAAYRVQAGW